MNLKHINPNVQFSHYSINDLAFQSNWLRSISVKHIHHLRFNTYETRFPHQILNNIYRIEIDTCGNGMISICSFRININWFMNILKSSEKVSHEAEEVAKPIREKYMNKKNWVPRILDRAACEFSYLWYPLVGYCLWLRTADVMSVSAQCCHISYWPFLEICSSHERHWRSRLSRCKLNNVLLKMHEFFISPRFSWRTLAEIVFALKWIPSPPHIITRNYSHDMIHLSPNYSAIQHLNYVDELKANQFNNMSNNNLP